jgi:hypothetical protein
MVFVFKIKIRKTEIFTNPETVLANIFDKLCQETLFDMRRLSNLVTSGVHTL